MQMLILSTDVDKLGTIPLVECYTLQVDYFFVPPLTMLADKLQLPPSIAGITLLALGNGQYVHCIVCVNVSWTCL